jgi:hypothetical protein
VDAEDIYSLNCSPCPRQLEMANAKLLATLCQMGKLYEVERCGVGRSRRRSRVNLLSGERHRERWAKDLQFR